MRSIKKNNIWEMVTLPKDKVPIEVKWVFKVNFKPDGTVEKHKTKLVAKDFMQRKGMDFSEVFADEYHPKVFQHEPCLGPIFFILF